MEPAIFGAWAFAVFVSVVIGKYIYDWYHETDRRNRLATAQVKLLAKIAVAQGVNAETVNQIVTEAKIKDGKS